MPGPGGPNTGSVQCELMYPRGVTGYFGSSTAAIRSALRGAGLASDVRFGYHNYTQDPLAYLTRYQERFTSLHLKDRTADGRMADVGSGAIDWRRTIAAAARAAGVREARF